MGQIRRCGYDCTIAVQGRRRSEYSVLGTEAPLEPGRIDPRTSVVIVYIGRPAERPPTGVTGRGYQKTVSRKGDRCGKRTFFFLGWLANPRRLSPCARLGISLEHVDGVGSDRGEEWDIGGNDHTIPACRNRLSEEQALLTVIRLKPRRLGPLFVAAYFVYESRSGIFSASPVSACTDDGDGSVDAHRCAEVVPGRRIRGW